MTNWYNKVYLTSRYDHVNPFVEIDGSGRSDAYVSINYDPDLIRIKETTYLRRVLLSRSVFMTEEETLGAEGYEGEYIVTPYCPGPTSWAPDLK